MNAQSIFVIDDNPDFRMLCRQALKTQGFACQTFEDGSKALDSLKSLDLQLPDLVFVDLTMPGMDGETFLREVRANERTQNLKVVVTSGWDNIKERADQAGADGFLKKPFDLTTLFKFVRARLSEPSL